jgi:hypothetical protein
MSTEHPKGWYGDPENRDQQRFWNGEAWTDQRRPDPNAAPEPFEVNPIALALAGIGILLAIIGVFLPHVQQPGLAPVQDNTLIASGDGWIAIGGAVGAAIAIYAAYNNQRRTFGPLVFGVILAGLAIFEGTGDRVQLHSVTGAFSGTINAKPDVGVYMVGAGGAVLILAGFMFAGMGSSARALPKAGTKKCPECAEAVLVDAKVCKHCGYRFDAEENLAAQA